MPSYTGIKKRDVITSLAVKRTAIPDYGLRGFL
jgi:hypothetical protein